MNMAPVSNFQARAIGKWSLAEVNHRPQRCAKIAGRNSGRARATKAGRARAAKGRANRKICLSLFFIRVLLRLFAAMNLENQKCRRGQRADGSYSAHKLIRHRSRVPISPAAEERRRSVSRLKRINNRPTALVGFGTQHRPLLSSRNHGPSSGRKLAEPAEVESLDSRKSPWRQAPELARPSRIGALFIAGGRRNSERRTGPFSRRDKFLTPRLIILASVA